MTIRRIKNSTPLPPVANQSYQNSAPAIYSNQEGNLCPTPKQYIAKKCGERLVSVWLRQKMLTAAYKPVEHMKCKLAQLHDDFSERFPYYRNELMTIRRVIPVYQKEAKREEDNISTSIR